MKNRKLIQKGFKIDDVALNGSFWTHKKYGVQIFSKKWNPISNRWVFVRNPDTSKEIVHFVHEVHPVFAVTLSTFCTCYVGEMMIPCQLSTSSKFICSAFQFHGHLAQKISKCMKNRKWVRKGWKLMMWLRMVHVELTKSLELK